MKLVVISLLRQALDADRPLLAYSESELLLRVSVTVKVAVFHLVKRIKLWKGLWVDMGL